MDGKSPSIASGLSGDYATYGVNGDDESLLRDNMSGVRKHRWPTWRDFIPTTPWTISLTLVVLVQSLATIGLGAGLYWPYASSNLRAVQLIVLGQLCTVVIESCYLVGLCLDATRTLNIVEAIGVCLNSLSMLILVAISRSSTMHMQDGRMGNVVGNIYIAMLTVLSAGTLGASYITWRVSYEFAWYEKHGQHLPSLND